MIPKEATVSASRKVQLEEYQPIESYVSETYSVPDSIDDRDEYDAWLEERQDAVMAAAEQAAMRRYEEHVREEAFGE